REITGAVSPQWRNSRLSCSGFLAPQAVALRLPDVWTDSAIRRRNFTATGVDRFGIFVAHQAYGILGRAILGRCAAFRYSARRELFSRQRFQQSAIASRPVDGHR